MGNTNGSTEWAIKFVTYPSPCEIGRATNKQKLLLINTFYSGDNRTVRSRGIRLNLNWGYGSPNHL